MTHLLNASFARILHAAREKPCIFPVVGVQVKSILFFMLGYLYLIWDNSFVSLPSKQLVRASLPRLYELSCSVRTGCCFPSFGLPSLKRTKKNQKRKQKERKKNATPLRRRQGFGGANLVFPHRGEPPGGRDKKCVTTNGRFSTRRKGQFTFHTLSVMVPCGPPKAGAQRKSELFNQAYLLSAGASNLGAQRK